MPRADVRLGLHLLGQQVMQVGGAGFEGVRPLSFLAGPVTLHPYHHISMYRVKPTRII
jgi:hypothetical protein